MNISSLNIDCFTSCHVLHSALYIGLRNTVKTDIDICELLKRVKQCPPFISVFIYMHMIITIIIIIYKCVYMYI